MMLISVTIACFKPLKHDLSSFLSKSDSRVNTHLLVMLYTYCRKCHSVTRIEERSILNQIVEKALECNSCLMRIAEFALSCHDGDLSILAGKLILPLKVIFT